jgi:hypothetical protein
MADFVVPDLAAVLDAPERLAEREVAIICSGGADVSNQKAGPRAGASGRHGAAAQLSHPGEKLAVAFRRRAWKALPPAGEHWLADIRKEMNRAA